MRRHSRLLTQLLLLLLIVLLAFCTGCTLFVKQASVSNPGTSDEPRQGSAVSSTSISATTVLAASAATATSRISAADHAEAASFPYAFKDIRGNPVILSRRPVRVVSAEGSFAEIWLLAGGNIIGVPNDVQTEGRLAITPDMHLIGSIKEPNAEVILSLQPDFVILSADIEGHARLADILRQNSVPYAFFKVEYFEDYLQMLKICTDLTGQSDFYQTNGIEVRARIQSVLGRVAGRTGPKVLLIRAFAKGAKARNDENATGAMLKELGAENIAGKYPSLLEEISLEQIVIEDPDILFITTMGSSEQALAYLEQGIMANPAWQGLKAVREKQVFILSKDLFQYKPNSRWDKAYDTLARILYPEAKREP